MKNIIPSSKSAMSRTKPSTPAKYLFDNNLLVGKCLDYGCGKGKDADSYNMKKFDPEFFSRISNRKI